MNCFFFSSRRRHTRYWRDWSSDVCSSDLSLFFSISPDAARTQVAQYLVLTMAPFAVVAPLLGPWIDRAHGGRRSMVILSAAGRVALCILMIDDLDGLLLFPEALAVLVLAKGYSVARASLVPGLVRDESELVEANARLI